MIEGIFECCDSTTSHCILAEATVLRVHGNDPYNKNARSELIRRAEKATLDFKQIREMRFCGVNITRDGMEMVDVPPPQSSNTQSDEKENII